MLRITNLTLRRGHKVLLEQASLTVFPGHKLGPRWLERLRQVQLVLVAAPRIGARRGNHRPAAALGDRPRRAGHARGHPLRARLCAGRRPGIARGRSGAGGRRSRPCDARRNPRRVARTLHRHRRPCRRRARGGAAARAGLCFGPARKTGHRVFRRLADAPQSGAGADVPLRPAAARRADQPPRSRRRAVARGLARALSGHAAADHPRPRFSRRDGRCDRAFRGPPAARLSRQLRAVRGAARRTARAAANDLRQAAKADRAPAIVRRPLSRQGDQGQAGAEPPEDAGKDGSGGQGAYRYAVQLFLSPRRTAHPGN